MKIYSHKDIEPVYVVGDCHGEFKTFFWTIKNGLIVKSEDEEKPHPKEAEWQERMMRRALEHTLQHRYGRNGRGDRNENPFDGNPFDVPSPFMKKIKYPSGQANRYANSIFIVAGDCGFGFNKPKYYEDLLARYNKILSYNNTYVYFVRGNHDDPAYFDGNTVNLSNIKAVPDYSVIETKSHNVLCVGGGLSVDRVWRKEQESRINRFSSSYKKKLYWADEMPLFNSDELKEICSSMKVDCVVTHTAPSFVSPQERPGLDEWSENDKELRDDAIKERIIMDKIFESLRDNDSTPFYWAYGHFNIMNIERRSNTIFRALRDGSNPINISQDITSFELNEMALKKKKKKSSAKSLSATIDEEQNDLIGEELDVREEERDDLPNFGVNPRAIQEEDDRAFEDALMALDENANGEAIAAGEIDGGEQIVRAQANTLDEVNEVNRVREYLNHIDAERNRQARAYNDRIFRRLDERYAVRPVINNGAIYTMPYGTAATITTNGTLEGNAILNE